MLKSFRRLFVIDRGYPGKLILSQVQLLISALAEIGAAALILMVLILWSSLGTARAQESGEIQVLTGSLEPGEFLTYRLPGLKSGQTLYVHMQGTSGNLDPVVGLLEGDADPRALEEFYLSELQRAVAEGRDPLLAVRDAFSNSLLDWDDDSGGGLAAALAFPVPADGDYLLLVSSALSALGRGTFGDYRLTVGLDAPEVLTGEVPSATGTLEEGEIAYLDREASPPGEAVEEITGTLTASEQILELRNLLPGDTLYVYVEATSGDLPPAVELQNFAGKPLQVANLSGQAMQTTLEHTQEQEGRNYKLAIVGCCNEGETTSTSATGEYRLLVGVNVPQVLTGQAVPAGRPVIEQPVPVQIGLKLQQVVDVDAQNESFSVVGSMQMEWTDPALAFSPESCDCVLKIYTADNFGQFLEVAQGRWPEFTLFNQQGNRWTQNRLVVVAQNGQALYFERFSTDLQVDFDFRRYPLDRQEFVIHVDAIYPEDSYYFVELEGYNEIASGHGEDEFDIGELQTKVTSEEASTRATTSRFTFQFEGPRHPTYYILQIFLPILLILVVSWVIFFLKDYGRRIEVASANMLVFIAFSFSLADNYPRLGYLTLLDAIMVVTFVASALGVIYNVWLRRLEMNDQAELADRIDSVLDWLYPLLFVAAGVVLYVAFF